MNKAKYLRQWRVGRCVSLILLCVGVLVSQVWAKLDGRKELSWSLVGILVLGIVGNGIGILRAYEIERVEFSEK